MVMEKILQFVQRIWGKFFCAMPWLHHLDPWLTERDWNCVCEEREGGERKRESCESWDLGGFASYFGVRVRNLAGNEGLRLAGRRRAFRHEEGDTSFYPPYVSCSYFSFSYFIRPEKRCYYFKYYLEMKHPLRYFKLNYFDFCLSLCSLW